MERSSMQTSITTLFFALIQVTIGKRQKLPITPSEKDWAILFEHARRQALIGWLYTGIEQLPPKQQPNRQLLLQWYAISESTKQINRRMNKRVVEAHKWFSDNGFSNTIFKGQAVARYYTEPLLRTPGDIDIWLDGGKRRILQWASSYGKISGLNYCHLHFPLFKDTEVEVHFCPSYVYAPYHNKRIQNWFISQSASQFSNIVELPEDSGYISATTTAFDRVYILLHIYRHFFGEGIGLRQITDYYYVLRKGCTESEREKAVTLIKQFGLERFARAISWILEDVFKLDEEYRLIPPDKDEGIFVLSEIMMSGNFGKYDSRYNRSNHNHFLPRIITSIRRNIHFIHRYPREVFWNPIFRTVRFLNTRLTLLSVSLSKQPVG